MDNVSYQHHGNIEKLNKHDTIKIIHSLKTITTWNFLKNHLCHEVHGKGEWVMNQLEDWNSKPISYGHCSNYTGSRKDNHSKAASWLPWIEISFLKHEISHDISILFH